MKRIKFKTAVSLIAALTLTTTVSAEVIVSQNFDKGTIVFGGQTTISEDFVNVKIQNGDTDVLVLEGKSETDKKYGFNIVPSFETGIYDIAIKTYDFMDEGTFAYVNKSDAEDVFDILNNAPETSDVENMFKNEKKRIVLQGMDYDYTKLTNKDALYNALIENAAYNGEMSDKMNKLRAAGVLCTIYESTTPEMAKKITDKNAEILGISKIDAYTIGNKEYIKPEFTKNLYENVRKLSVYSLDKFGVQYREQAMLCAAKNLKSTAYIGELLKDMNEDIKYTEFNSLSNSEKAKIGTEITFSENYTNVADMVNAFNNKVNNILNGNNNGGLGGGTGGGGGGGSASQNATTTVPVMSVEKEPEVEVDFEDMTECEWAREAVNYLKNLGVINGYDERTFAPSKNVTREEFVKMIVNAFKISAKNTGIQFDDVKNDDWYYNSVMNAAYAAIINGVTENMFGAGENITRQDAASIIFRTLNYKGILLDVGDVDFVDKEEIAEYAYDAVSALKNSRYIKGNDDNTFAPERFLSRAEAAQMIYSAIWRGEK